MDIQKIAQLAKFHLSSEEQILFQKEISSIFQWIDSLQSIEGLPDIKHPIAMRERPDIVELPPLPDELVKNAPYATHNMFGVPKVVES